MKHPLAVTIIGCLFIVARLAGLVYRLSDRPLDRWIVSAVVAEMLSTKRQVVALSRCALCQALKIVGNSFLWIRMSNVHAVAYQIGAVHLNET